MNLFPTRIDTPLNQPLFLMEQLPEEVFQSYFFKFGYNNFRKNNKDKVNRKLWTYREYKAFLSRNKLVTPTGFIFHPSRVGSTLVCAMLSELNNSRVIIEADSINQFAKLKYIHQETAVKNIEFENIINGYTITQGNVDKVFFKFSSWLTNCFEQIMIANSNIPWLYIYRNPLEILVSNISRPSFVKYLHIQTKFGSYITGLKESDLTKCSIERLACLVLKRNMEQVLKNKSSANSLIIEYTNIKRDFVTRILPHFKVMATPKEYARIVERSQYYSKNHVKVKFQPDSHLKRQKVSSTLKSLVKEYGLFELYDALRTEETKQKMNFL